MLKVSELKEWATYVIQDIIEELPTLDFTYAPLEEIKEYIPLRNSLLLVVNKSVTSKNKNTFDVIIYKNHSPKDITKKYYRAVQISEDNQNTLTIYLVLENLIDRSPTREILQDLEKILNTYKQ